MSNKFNSEFSKIFSNSCSVENTDWNAPRYFDGLENECYDSETALLSSLTSEAYSQFGFTVQYFIKKISTERDKLYGEDVLENVERRFELSVYTGDVPHLQKIYKMQGMDYIEVISVQATIKHFKEASQIDYVTKENVWKEVVPKIGDIMYLEWCDLYYEVVNVKKFGEGSTFLSVPITYMFNLRVWRNSHESVDLTDKNHDPMEYLSNYVSLSETFNLERKSSLTKFENNGEVQEEELKTSNVDSKNDRMSINEFLEDKQKNEIGLDEDIFGGW